VHNFHHVRNGEAQSVS